MVPFGILLSLGFTDILMNRGAISWNGFTLDFLTGALSDPLYCTTFRRSLTLALTTTAICLLFGFP